MGPRKRPMTDASHRRMGGDDTDLCFVPGPPDGVHVYTGSLMRTATADPCAMVVGISTAMAPLSVAHQDD
ncbi:hypothetical protein M8818_000201 [Zalaria obscura]|uniref:Uncharacterized protein n=1 Tax=Zalaria obscura TaxID=2024903 RepID=A0ACC3SNX3_9PEZI